MDSQELSIDLRVRAACGRDETQAATTLVLETYGPEIGSFILAKLRGDSSAADEVYSDFMLDLLRGLPKFQWRCPIQAWCYVLARNAINRFKRAPSNQGARRVALSQAPFLEDLVQPARPTTQPYLRSEVKDEFTELREKLSPDDQDLLILRVDRNLSWRDIAHALVDPEAPPADEAWLKKREAALRQRFTEVKRRLHELAEQAGLLRRSGEPDG